MANFNNQESETSQLITKELPSLINTTTIIVNNESHNANPLQIEEVMIKLEPVDDLDGQGAKYNQNITVQLPTLINTTDSVKKEVSWPEPVPIVKHEALDDDVEKILDCSDDDENKSDLTKIMLHNVLQNMFVAKEQGPSVSTNHPKSIKPAPTETTVTIKSENTSPEPLLVEDMSIKLELVDDVDNHDTTVLELVDDVDNHDTTVPVKNEAADDEEDYKLDLNKIMLHNVLQNMFVAKHSVPPEEVSQSADQPTSLLRQLLDLGQKDPNTVQDTLTNGNKLKKKQENTKMAVLVPVPPKQKIDGVEKKRDNSNRPYNFQCAECGKKFRDKFFVRKHIESVHLKFLETCGLCNKSVGAYYIKHHMEMHKKGAYCEPCRKWFSLSGYKAHMKTTMAHVNPEHYRKRKKERNRKYQRAWRQRKKDTPYFSDDEKKEEDERKRKQRNKEYSKRYRDKKRSMKKKDSKEEKEEKKRKRHRENQRAYYQRTRGLKENDKNVDELSQNKLDDLQKKRKKLDSTEAQENVVKCRASQNVENVQLEQNQFLTQQLHIYEESHECITPEVMLHRNTDIPGDGNCLFHSLIRILHLPISTCDLRRQLRDSSNIDSCHNPQEAYNILSSNNEYGDLDCLYLFTKIYNQNICVHYHFFNVISKSEDTRFCHFKANDTHNWIHLDLRERHFTPYLSDDEKKEEDERKRKQRNKEYSKRYRDKKRSLKKTDSKEEKEEEKRKRHRENQRAYYQRTKGLKENDKNVEELFQNKLDDLQMKINKLDSSEDQENVKNEDEKKRKQRNREYSKRYRDKKRSMKKKDSKEEKEEKKRKRHRENQRAYYQRTKCLKENDKNVEELSQNKLDDLQMFACDECGLRFHRNTNLTRHINRVHLKKEKPYKCPQCPSAYEERRSLNSHIKFVHERTERPRNFICDHCGAAMYTKRNLASHMVRHTGVRPYKCNICGAAFGYSVVLATHMKRKHGDKQKTDKAGKSG